MALPAALGELIEEGRLGHLVSLSRDGAPQVTCVWVPVEGDDLVTAHLNPRRRRLENVRRGPRVAISSEGTKIRPPGPREYAVVHGRATIEEGGPSELLHEFAGVDLGPEVTFPPMDRPPPGVRRWIAIEPVGGVGSWAE